MVSYPQGDTSPRTVPQTAQKCPPARRARRSKPSEGDTTCPRGTHGGHIFSPLCPPKNLSVSNGFVTLGGHRGHMSTTYRHSSALIGLKSRNGAVENAIANQVSPVSPCKNLLPAYPYDFSTGRTLMLPLVNDLLAEIQARHFRASQTSEQIPELQPLGVSPTQMSILTPENAAISVDYSDAIYVVVSKKPHRRVYRRAFPTRQAATRAAKALRVQGHQATILLARLSYYAEVNEQ